MRFEQTKEYNNIEIFLEQKKIVSSVERINQELKKDGNYGFNIYIDDCKIGFALLRKYEENTFFLWDYIIHKNFQNRGYGTKALIELLSFFKKQFSIKRVITTYIFGNEHAKYIYEKIGFTEIDVVDEDGIHEVNMQIIL